MLADVIKSLGLIVKLMKSDFVLFYYKNTGDNTFYISTTEFEIYSSEKFLKYKKLAKRLLKDKKCKLIFCCIGDFEKFSNKEKMAGRNLFKLLKQYKDDSTS